MKTERTQIHFLSDVFVAVASLDLKVPNISKSLVPRDFSARPRDERRKEPLEQDCFLTLNIGKNNSLVPIVAEQYGNLKYGVKHYAVAVVKKSNTGFNLKSLKGKNSCHSGARTVEGWNVPIGYMLREKIIAPVRCDTEFHDFYSAANFFEWSCVPGEL